MQHFMQLPLTATCDVSVNIDAKGRLLRLEATGAKLRVRFFLKKTYISQATRLLK